MRPETMVSRFFLQCLFIAVAALLNCVWVNGDEATDWAPDLQPGDPLPAFTLLDDDGISHDSRSLPGEHGLLLFFNRSTDW
jgi:hypothetical protein